METFNLDKKYPCRNERDCIWRVIDKETVVFSDDGLLVHELNGTGAEIWKMCDGKASIPQIVNKIYEEFDVQKEEAETEVKLFVDTLHKKGLIMFNGEKRNTKTKDET